MTFPKNVKEIENLWITLEDSTRLAARLWLPEDASETNRVPALLEYLPYRKNDGTAIRDSIRHPYLASYGYACLRVDMRGTGDSEGVLLDEYLPREQEDALEILQWLEDQPWCTGAVGMFGISWGGFNSLQVAARQPRQLKAIISICSTDDRYSDDVHYIGGCVLASQMLPWASVMLAYNATPPDPRFVGDRWLEIWLERLEKTPPFVETWLSHQRRDAYWKQGSVCEDYNRINIPVYLVGGWADGYPNAIPRLLAGLTCPRKALIGPWAHNFPDEGKPGPAIGFLQESLRWWDQWLKGIDTGIMNEPMLRCWLQDSQLPRPVRLVAPGRWVAENSWPSPNISDALYYLNADPDGSIIGTLDPTQVHVKETTISFKGVQSAGTEGGEWCPYGLAGDFPTSQRAEDGRSLTFTSKATKKPMDILGCPKVTLTLSCDKPVALIAVRLCDVFPDGESSLVSWGLLNLTHRSSHEHPSQLVPGNVYNVTIMMKMVGYSLPVGHRWRVAISPTYWPHAWPSPESVTLTIITGSAKDPCTLALPIRVPQDTDAALPMFRPVEHSPPIKFVVLREGHRSRTLIKDVIAGRAQLLLGMDEGRIKLLDSELEYEDKAEERMTINEDDPLSATIEASRIVEFSRGSAWRVRVETNSTMACDTTHFVVSNCLTAYSQGEVIFKKVRDFKVARDLV